MSSSPWKSITFQIVVQVLSGIFIAYFLYEAGKSSTPVTTPPLFLPGANPYSPSCSCAMPSSPSSSLEPSTYPPTPFPTTLEPSTYPPTPFPTTLAPSTYPPTPFPTTLAPSTYPPTPFPLAMDATVMCGQNAFPGKPSDAKYRYVGNQTLRWYPSESILYSYPWQFNTGDPQDCKNFSLGEDLLNNPTRVIPTAHLE